MYRHEKVAFENLAKKLEIIFLFVRFIMKIAKIIPFSRKSVISTRFCVVHNSIY